MPSGTHETTAAGRVATTILISMHHLAMLCALSAFAPVIRFDVRSQRQRSQSRLLLQPRMTGLLDDSLSEEADRVAAVVAEAGAKTKKVRKVNKAAKVDLLDDSLSEEADRVAAVVAEARAKAKRAESEKAAAKIAAVAPAPAASSDAEPAVYDIGAVDVDMCLSFNQADALSVESEADSVFDVIDLDGDGRITKDELISHFGGAEMLGSQDVDRIFEIVDVAPTDGSISRAELRTAFLRYESITMRLALGLATGRQLQPSRARRALADEVFDIIDANHDGQITNSELRAHLVSRGVSVSKTTADAVFTALDIDHDGSISRSELRGAFGRYEYSAVRLALGFPRRAVV